MREMAKIIGEDGSLLGGLLKLANSSFYRGSGSKPIESLEKAVVFVGTDGLRSLVATALLHPVMTATRGRFSSFAEATWEHSQYAAGCAELHAVRIERTDAFSARLLVLLLGLASNTVFRIAREHCLAMNDMSPGGHGQAAGRLGAADSAANCRELAAVRGPVQRACGAGRTGTGALTALRAAGGGAACPGESRTHARTISARDRARRRSPSRTEVDRLWSRLAIMHLTATR